MPISDAQARLNEQLAGASRTYNTPSGWTPDQYKAVMMGGPAPGMNPGTTNPYDVAYVKPTFTGTRTSSGGNVGSKTGKTDAQKAQEAKARAEAAWRKSMSGTFNSTIDAYKNMIGWLPEEQSSLQGQVENLAGTQKTSIQDALNAALGRYEGYRGEVLTDQKNTLQDLANNTRNMFAAGNNYLGARGAGNSSATGMYSAALTQQSNKQRGEVQRQVGEQNQAINTSEEDTRGQAQQQLDAVETWKSTRVTEIVQQYQDLKRQLTIAKAQASDAKKAALAELDRSLFESAINNLNNIQQMAASYKSEVASNIGEQNAQNSSILGAVSTPSQNYKVGDIVAENIEGLPNIQSDGQGNYLDGSSGSIYRKNEDGTFTYLGTQA